MVNMQQMKNVSKSKLFQKFMKKQNQKSESTPKNEAMKTPERKKAKKPAVVKKQNSPSPDQQMRTTFGAQSSSQPSFDYKGPPEQDFPFNPSQAESHLMDP